MPNGPGCLPRVSQPPGAQGPDARYSRPGVRRTPGHDRPDLSLNIARGEVAMARRTSPPFRADHVGSLLRPQRLLQARDDFAAGRITPADLTAVEDEVIPAAIAMQEEVGLQSATDGEFRRASWNMDFIYALGGVSKAPGNMAVKFHNAAGDIEFTPASIRVDSK